VTAQIYTFPDRVLCTRCEHYTQLNNAGYCQLLDKLVGDVEIAKDCPGFEPPEVSHGEGQ